MQDLTSASHEYAIAPYVGSILWRHVSDAPYLQKFATTIVEIVCHVDRLESDNVQDN
jgi:hypothetical protein